MSENFANQNAKGTLRAPLTGTVSTTAGLTPLTISYNASNQSYTMTQGSMSQTFTPANIDASQSDALQTTYVATNGSTQNVLSLIKTGTGAGQTRYVAAGIWQQQVNGATAVDGTINAFAYGIQTPAASVPRTGSASFDVTLIGARTWQTSVWAIGGTGILNVDFITGGMAGGGTFREVRLDTGTPTGDYGWRAHALISSGTNSFAGILNLDNVAPASLQGAFYGPAANEIGAVWWVDGDDAASVGAIYGARGTYPVNQATTVQFPEHDIFFKPLATSVRASINGSDILSSPAANTALSSVYIKQGTLTPVFYRAGPQIYNGGTYEYYPINLTYMRAGQMLDKGASNVTLDSYTYGFETKSSDMPRTGSAHYTLALRAGLLAPGKELQTVRGYGDMLAMFASGTLEVDGTYSIYTYPPASGLGDGTPSGSPNDSGTWSGTANISGSGFSGNLSLDGTTDYTGSMQGQFYGPHSDEVGAVFRLTGGNSQVSGTLAGALSDAPYGGNSTLAGLTDTTVLGGHSVAVYNGSNDGSFRNQVGKVKVTYDPQAKTYAILTEYDVVHSFGQQLDVTLGPSNKDGSVIDPGFTHYKKGDVSGRILNTGPGNPVINLSYASFGQFTAPGVDYAQPIQTEHFTHFGLLTAPDRVPTTGSANYSGIVFGAGAGTDNQVKFQIGGTSAMNYNFANYAFTSTLNLNIVGGGSLGTFKFASDSQSPFANYFFGYNADDSFRGNYSGSFYGPNAEEFGASWEVNVPSANCCGDASRLYGVTVGAKN